MLGSAFHFHEEFQLGINEIDTQLRNLVDLLNEIHQLVADGNRQQAKDNFMDSLTKYVVEHFFQEELFMEEIHYLRSMSINKFMPIFVRISKI